eukprot:GEMP01041573.1.p1 GENE.GEMP01041573.1~~GEMP01041573.1.p1  ORF type:complete len:340 (+),score=36.93 GEMP01041573.1:101-1120(+)
MHAQDTHQEMVYITRNQGKHTHLPVSTFRNGDVIPKRKYYKLRNVAVCTLFLAACLTTCLILTWKPTYAETNGTGSVEGDKTGKLTGRPTTSYGGESRIFIAVPTHDRIGYVQFTSAVLASSERVNASNVFVFDDCSTQYSVEDLQRMYGAESHIIRIQPCLEDAFKSSRYLYEYFVHNSAQYDIICVLDSDLVVLPSWEATFNAFLPNTDGVLSLYNSGDPRHESYNCAFGLCEKPSVGNAGVCMRKNVVESMLRGNQDYAFDWGFSHYFERNKIRMMVIEHSVVTHIGVWGQNSRGNITELAVGFNRSASPQWVQDGIRFYLDNKTTPDIIFLDEMI